MEKSARFLSLDVFRGMTVCFMIIVNTPGSGATAFAPLEHAAWHGFTPTDLVFPSFLFAVGNAMSFALKKQGENSTAALVLRILKRAALIFLIGYLLSWFPFFRLHDGVWHFTPISHTRILGVLPRIALCYLFASLMIVFLSERTLIVCSVFFLIAYWGVLLVFGDATDPFGMVSNAGYYLDKFVLGADHMYHGEGVPFDPEGILSTLPSIVNVIVGYFAGRFIQQSGKNHRTLSKLLLLGGFFIFIALCIDPVFPINKKLWTSSFVFITTGLDLVILAFLIYLLEVENTGQHSWTKFFTVFGKNPLFIYITADVLIVALDLIPAGQGHNFISWINTVFYQRIAPGPLGSLLFAVSFMLLCWFVGWILDRRKIYVRV